MWLDESFLLVSSDAAVGHGTEGLVQPGPASLPARACVHGSDIAADENAIVGREGLDWLR